MAEPLDIQLAQVRDDMRRRQKLENDLRQTRESLLAANLATERLGAELDKEHADVRKLEGFSLAGVLAFISGNKIERLDAERQQLAAVKLKYDERLEATATLEREAKELESALRALGDVDARHAELIAAKERYLLEQPSAVARELTELAEDIVDAHADQRELDEAMLAANAAHEDLRAVESSLVSARGWGTFDMLGGGLIAGLAKHGHIKDAKAAANRAQGSLRRLQRELGDVNMRATVGVDVGGLATFADIFFDGLLTDWIVQSKIGRSRANVESAMRRVEQIRSELQIRSRRAREHAAELQHRRSELIAAS